MDKMKMHTPNMADENYHKLAALFPNAVTEAIDPETGEVLWRLRDPEAATEVFEERYLRRSLAEVRG